MKKKLKKELKDYKILIILLGVFPFGIYLLFFNNTTFKIDSEKWAHFGDFIGGFGAIIFGAGNLYFLIKLSYKLSQIDDDRNNKNNELEEIRNKQNQIDSVVPYLIATTFNNEITNEIVLKIINCGIGPSIIVDCKYIYDNKEFSEIKPIITLITKNRIFAKVKSNELSEGSAIPMNSEILIFEIKMYQHEHQDKDSYISAINYVIKELSKIKGSVTYTNLYKSEKFILEIKDYEL